MKGRIFRCLMCLLMCLGLLAGVSAVSQAQAEGLEVHFLDLERKDGILIRCGGEDVFIDSGGSRQGTAAVAYMNELGVTSLKYYIGTHAHSDHIGGATRIIAAFKPDAILQSHDRVKEYILKHTYTPEQKAVIPNTDFVTMKPGDQVRVGGATLTCLGPLTIKNCDPGSGTENANSLVLMLTYGEVDILLAADATGGSLRAIEAAMPGSLKADVYKNAHHDEQTYQDVFEKIDPDYVVFCTAKGYLPKSSYMEILNKHGVRSLMTTPNHSGNIVLHSDGRTYSFETQRTPQAITLRQSEISIYEGKSATLKVATQPYNWAKIQLYVSDNPAVATVSATGRITGVSAGTTNVRVIDGTGMEAVCTVTVKPATLTLRKTALSVRQHSKVTATWKIEPSGSKAVIAWASLNEDVATVDAKGRITGVYPGEATITATMPSGQVCYLAVTVTPVKVSSVSIKPSSATMTIGDSKSFTATVSPKNATWPDITWSSQDESIVTITQDGLVKAVGVGKTTITAQTPEGKKRTARITVKPLYVKKIVLSGEVTGLIGGVAGRNQVRLGYEIQPADATIQDVKWTTSNNKIATVDENGVVTGLKDGSVYITCKATDGSGRSARIRIVFGKNEMVRKTVQPVEGEMVCQAERIRYYGNNLEIQMKWINRTGTPQTAPQQGVLTLVLPDGTQLPLMNAVTVRQVQLKHRSTKTVTYKVPLITNPRLNGLDLTQCDAIIVTH